MEIFIVFGLIILAIVFIAYLSFKFIWKKGSLGKFTALSLLLVFSFLVITAIWPLDSFYINEFERETVNKLQHPAKVITKSSSYPDFHGDYYSEALIQLSEKDYKNILGKLDGITKINCLTPKVNPKYLNNIYSDSCWSTRKKIDQHFTVVFFSDGKTIYFRYIQT